MYELGSSKFHSHVVAFNVCAKKSILGLSVYANVGLNVKSANGLINAFTVSADITGQPSIVRALR